MRGEAGDHDGAEQAYRMAAILLPDNADLLLCWGHLQKRRGRPDEALALYRASLAIDGNDHAAREVAMLAPDPHDEQVEFTSPPEGATPIQDMASAETAGEDANILPEGALRRQGTAPLAGACEYFDREVVHGWLAAIGEDDEVVFLAGDEVVGRAPPAPHTQRGDGREFRAHLWINHAAEVRAIRRSDGADLAGSPFRAEPMAIAPLLGRRARDVRSVSIKPLRPPFNRDLALFVTHSATGAVKPHVSDYLRALAEQGIATLLIVVTDRPVHLGPDLIEIAAGIMIRDNVGYDFAAWAHALALYPEVYGAAALYLLNDSVVPASTARLGRTIARIRASTADLIGLTNSLEYRWHLQSYFLVLKPRALSTSSLQHFFSTVEIVDTKDDVIRHFELRLAQRAEEAGCRVETLFPTAGAMNPVLDNWRALLAQDFAFVKILLLRGTFPQIDLTGWRDALAAADFDLDLVDQVLRAEDDKLPADPDDRLYAHPLPRHPVLDPGPLKVALYGPWNYDNGLGSASRGLIGALRHAGVRLSLHPVKKPFHVHRPLAPAIDVRDFEGPADVAIIHLNPDSWHLLTDLQRAEIAAARRRVGYWVWEMGHIPDAWWHQFGSVDRIWAPSRYCADLFEAQDGAPVDVVPHAVPLPFSPTPDAAARAVLLRNLGVQPVRRVILYVFDGSSYLVRKNPAALIRAFAASGLAERGWTLLLKTKHLMDRRDEGEALRALAAGEAGVVLVDRALDPVTLDRLMACADIYASPHASEGFGLTVAEAMAAGRPVVATDFSGTADILDAGTGYPVRAHPWRLEQDYGHYTRGGEWARVDEPALSHALRRAADAVERGETTIGRAARARVATQLSFAAVGATIARSLAGLMIDRPTREPVRIEHLNLNAGLPIERGTGEPRVRAVALTANGAPGDDVPDGLAPDSWIAFAPAGSMLSPLLASSLLLHAAARPDAAIFYADDVAGAPEHPVDQFRLKPAFDRTLLSAQDYVGAPVMIRASALAALGGLNRAHGTAAVADLLFRADAAGFSIARIPEILLAHPGARVRATAADYAAMLAAQASLADFTIRPGRTPDTFRLDRRYDDGKEPPVTLVIPTRRSLNEDGSGSWIAGLLDDLAGTDWPMDRLTVIVGDDVDDHPEWASVPRPYTLRRIETPRGPDEPFNYAAKMNRLWREAATEQIVFMNDDIRLGAPSWLRALQTFALDRGVGGVGARLLFTDGSLQHAGIAPHGTGAAHAWLYRTRERGTFHDWALVHREWSMLTGAVFATRRSVMEEVGGFDEVFTVEFNDTDLCLRLRALGYRIVYTAHAEMTHAEKMSRGDALPSGETIARFLGRWSGWLEDDPAWHPLLRRDRVEVRPGIGRRQWFF